jgi:hypothetical protein
MPCAIAQLDPVVKGDTWDGLSVTMTSTGTELDDPLASVQMSFWLAGATTAALDLTSADGDITIEDADAWEFRVEAISPLTLAAGYYSWAIQTTDDAGRVKTYLKGTLPVETDLTL